LDTREKNKFIRTYNDLEKYNTLSDISLSLNVSERTIRRRAKKLRDDGENLVDRAKISQTSTTTATDSLSLKLKLTLIQQEKNKLVGELKKLHKELSSVKQIKELIHDTKAIINTTKIPAWLKSAKRSKQVTGIPVLFLSDIHFDEVIDGAQIGFVNSYNHDIAVKRIQHTFNTAINLLQNYMVNPKYDGIVCALGGDMLSGTIHDELAETNANSILASVIDLQDLLAEGITGLADSFGKVFVPCVVGNHGRLHTKPRHKNKVFDNFEWVIYQNLSKYFEKDNRVTFYIPDGPDAQFSIYDKNFLLTHGDQFRGGNGVAGVFSPIMLGSMRKQKSRAAVKKPFDIMMIGHFHQYIHTNSLIINGSIKGFCEFAANNNYSFEKPTQALFIVNQQYDIIMRTPILCDAYESDDKVKKFKQKIKIW
jgi:DNA-binding Lrp family transcriptional regulator